MNVYRNLENIPFFENTIVTLGTFDGCHLGHQALIQTLIQAAVDRNTTPVLVTFDPHPLTVIGQGKNVELLTTTDEKLEIFKELNLNHVFLMTFTHDMAGLSAEDFITKVLIPNFRIKGLIVGFNNTVGHDRSTLDSLTELSKKYDFYIQSVKPVTVDGLNVSSTAIRNAIANGQLKRANQWLGRPYSLSGLVESGKGIGRRLGFPTANIKVSAEKLIPKDGVYAGIVPIKGHHYLGLINIGASPTIPGKSWGLEIYIDNFKEIIYNTSLTIKFIKRLRDEIRFKSEEKLIQQINRDKENAQEILASYIRR